MSAAETNARVIDRASCEMLEKACADNITTCFDRADTQKPQCAFGKGGVCCRICHMGPCRITPKAPRGVCGADADTIAARNFLREVVGGTAAHSDHGRHLVLLLRKAALGQAEGYTIKDEAALMRGAKSYGVSTEGRPVSDIAFELSQVLLGEFSSQEEPLRTLELAPQKRRRIWANKGIEPYGVDRMCVEAMHRTTMGVDHDYRNLLSHAFRTSLSDGWGGARVASIVSDILFGTPTPVRSNANLGVLKENTVNIIIHGHEPALSEILAAAVSDPELIASAKAAGASGGITLAGICCTANEILMRHGVPVAGNLLQQELAIVTGAVEIMVIDVQCCMPSLPDVAKSYHTEIISTADIAKTIGAEHISVEESPMDSAKALVRRAIANYSRRDPSKLRIPDAREPLVAGFSVHAIKYMLGGTYRASFRPLNDAIIQNRILGVVGIVGCNNTKQQTDDYTIRLAAELIKRNVLVLQTGCAAIASGKAGMLKPELALSSAGDGLREVCEAVGIPPILHMGSCVDNSRILEAASEIVAEGGLGDDLGSLPAVGVAPEWMSEKAIAIGCYFVASGVDVVLGNPFYVSGAENVNAYLHGGVREDYGACFHLIEDPLEAADRIIELLNAKREALGINKKQERKLFDMKDRRGGEASPEASSADVDERGTLA